jgi:hypothetical protein
MSAALFTIRFTTASAGNAICLHFVGYGAVLTRSQILAHDGAHERARPHRTQLEKAHLFAR